MLKLCTIVDYVKQITNIPLCLILACSRGNMDIYSCLKKALNLTFFSDIIEARFFKLRMIIILLRVYNFIADLMIWTLLQGHSYVRNINCKLLGLDVCPQ